MANKNKPIKPPLLIGITGSIGSGKSTVARIFELMGAVVYDSDKEAKLLMNQSKPLREKIIRFFGAETYGEDGKLNRAILAEKVFNAPKELQRLNQIVHPAVAEHFKQWVHDHKESPVLIKEAAILFESKANRGLHQVVCVVAPRAVRMERVIQRDTTSAAQFEARESSQWPEAKKAENAHYLINNDGKHSLVLQAHNLWKHWLNILATKQAV